MACSAEGREGALRLRPGARSHPNFVGLTPPGAYTLGHADFALPLQNPLHTTQLGVLGSTAAAISEAQSTSSSL